jgi:hypothetical protein
VKYSEMREAFGVTIGKFPLVKAQIGEMLNYAKRTTAGAFKLYSEFLSLEGGPAGGIVKEGPLELKKKAFMLRELIMLQKMTASWDSTDVIRKAMSIFGGHGIMEDFSSLPRLYRDSAINELWEGPRNVLLTQIHNDLKKVSEWYSPEAFVRDVLSGADEALVKELAVEINQLVSHPSLFQDDEETVEVCRMWDNFCHRLYHSYQDCALAEVERKVPSQKAVR